MSNDAFATQDDFTVQIEEREILCQVLAAVLPQLTRRQLECLLLDAYGLTQREAGKVLGIAHQVVCKHLQKALGKVKIEGQKRLPKG